MSWLVLGIISRRTPDRRKRLTHLCASPVRKIVVPCLLTLIALTDSVSAMPGWARDVIDSSRQVRRHSDASAVILYHTIEAKVSSKGHTSMKIRRIVRVLSEKGAGAAIIAEGVGSQRKLTNLRGWHQRGDGSSATLNKKDAVFVKSRNTPGYYDDQQGLYASFPRVNSGSIIAYEYEIDAKEWSNPYTRIHLQSNREPVDYFSYRLKVPDGWVVEHAYHNIENVTFSQTRRTYVWRPWRIPLHRILESLPSYLTLHTRPTKPLICSFLPDGSPARCLLTRHSRIGRDHVRSTIHPTIP